jgi:pimeloyl-ACP methyl ester carboxylesterase
LIRLGFRIGGSISPKLAGRAAYKLWFTPPRFSTPASEQGALKSADCVYRKINGMNIATYHWGQSGPTVLLVHGWSGRGTQLGAFVEPLIDAGFRVLSFDAPAHGSSSGNQTTLYEIADVILSLNLQYGPFDSVITHSFGGPCLAVAIQRGLNTSEDSFGKNIFEQASMVNNVRDLDMPALVIHDEDDADIPWRDGEAVAQAWKNAIFIKTSTLGHRRILRDALMIETAVDFIKSK